MGARTLLREGVGRGGGVEDDVCGKLNMNSRTEKRLRTLRLAGHQQATPPQPLSSEVGPSGGSEPFCCCIPVQAGETLGLSATHADSLSLTASLGPRLLAEEFLPESRYQGTQ
jgi:hypothetical protein